MVASVIGYFVVAWWTFHWCRISSKLVLYLVFVPFEWDAYSEIWIKTDLTVANNYDLVSKRLQLECLESIMHLRRRFLEVLNYSSINRWQQIDRTSKTYDRIIIWLLAKCVQVMLTDNNITYVMYDAWCVSQDHYIMQCSNIQKQLAELFIIHIFHYISRRRHVWLDFRLNGKQKNELDDSKPIATSFSIRT